MDVPPDLRAALDAELQAVQPKALAEAVHRLSERYRLHHARSSAPFLQSPVEVAAYAAYRLPATFAAVATTFHEVRDRRPDFEPKMLLDLGGGPGTAAWAAAATWTKIEHVVILERDVEMIRMGQALAAHSDASALRAAIWRQLDVSREWDVDGADLTVAAYMLGELAPDAVEPFVKRLWRHTADVCVIVEPGTPRGFGLVRRAGDHLSALDAQIIAPFPHGWRCLESETDWCHFSQRVPRTRVHRSVKDATLSYEDEKYSYLAASRRGGLTIAARIIRHPQVRSGHVRLVLCTAEGVKHVVVTRRNKKAYRRAKDLAWGDAIPPHEAELFGIQPPS